MEEKQQLTVKEAIEKGFTQCGYSNIDFQHFIKLSELDSEDFERYNNSVLMLADTNPHYVTIDKQDILDMLLDRYYDVSPDDDTYDIKTCFEEQSAKIEQFASDMNEVYLQKEWYYLTNIELIP